MPALRKLTLTAHVVFSIGWIGALVAFLVLSVAGLTSPNPDIVRGSYVSMDLISRFAIIPMCFAALATGIIDAFVTPWGLFRYYWVVVKFMLTLIATFLLLMHENAIARAARWVSGAASTQLFVADFPSVLSFRKRPVRRKMPQRIIRTWPKQRSELPS